MLPPEVLMGSSRAGAPSTQQRSEQCRRDIMERRESAHASLEKV